jgi:ADP-ribosylglycohydrolase
MTALDRDRARAMFYGMALGDALGWPVEFLDLPQIWSKYGRAGITEPPDPALYTDDTQMSAALAEALIEAGHKELDSLMGAVARQFIGWKRHPSTPGRAPGATSIRGVSALERGAPWRQAGVKDSKGCGSCMRVAPVGYLFQADLARLERVAKAQGMLTHRHPTADVACVAAAYLVKLALDGVSHEAYIAALHGQVGGRAPEFDAAINRLESVLGWPDEETALREIGPTRGGGWMAQEAVAMALYCVLRRPADFAASVRLAANIGGDSDSVAALAGAIQGVRLGSSAIPAEWLERLENREYLTGLADRLADKKAAWLATTRHRQDGPAAAPKLAQGS